MTSAQKPVESSFTAASTASEVMAGVDLTGQLAVVTGGYSGIGLVTAKSLALAGAQVIVPARDIERAQAAMEGIENISIHEMDLMNPESIHEFSQRVASRGRALSLLINCAGVMAAPLIRDADGHESQFSINHLGHFRLTCALWPMLVAAGQARVVSMSSRGHQIAGVDFDDIDFLQRPYDKWVAYGQSKTANALFAIALDRRGRSHGVRAFSLHPGQILTDLARHLSAEEIAGFDALDEQGRPRIAPEAGMKTVEQGAATGLWCATSKALDGKGGVYCEDCNVAPINESGTGRKGVKEWAANADFAERLWTISERWTGLTVD
ncbi:NADP-dependent 3-hydroxy acid dehydrogenase YdfG [Pseudomonas reinekei]|jgi:NAD(P)-dependent dehydrogenase (short-subunit alcohol dehydrogenase family)|uniref:Probable oxidoreductase n=1 Tax=Pseudomonas reinekei TaxID=395598 RepID=A0A1H0U158_PSERE|nr:oxidoreductase [Pseudomonas reinekei]KAB0488089.1 SDR family NAD(P)-dependent oxidoreductase [Pseudomonas reinekei]OLU05523.1 oxidoreductase [Pseudomonas reinekei]SDP60022.1 NADP-dependent 3-hydroxy acid dehydrogenase YdfG [Pseudomonas reinekei]